MFDSYRDLFLVFTQIWPCFWPGINVADVSYFPDERFLAVTWTAGIDFARSRYQQE